MQDVYTMEYNEVDSFSEREERSENGRLVLEIDDENNDGGYWFTAIYI